MSALLTSGLMVFGFVFPTTTLIGAVCMLEYCLSASSTSGSICDVSKQLFFFTAILIRAMYMHVLFWWSPSPVCGLEREEQEDVTRNIVYNNKSVNHITSLNVRYTESKFCSLVERESVPQCPSIWAHKHTLSLNSSMFWSLVQIWTRKETEGWSHSACSPRTEWHHFHGTYNLLIMVIHAAHLGWLSVLLHVLCIPILHVKYISSQLLLSTDLHMVL